MLQLMKKTNQNKGMLFCYLFILMGLFICFELGIFIQGSELYLGDYQYVSEHIAIPTSVIPGIINFICIQLALHFVFVLWAAYMAYYVGRAWRYSASQTEFLGIGLLLFGLTTILLANQYFYPNSKFALIASQILPSLLLKYLLIGCVIVLCLLMMIAIIEFIHRKITIKKMSIGCVAILGFFSYHFFSINHSQPSNPSQPNIILIGVDSLRPDYLGAFGSASHMPVVDALLEDATIFAEAFTPLARTFPSWVSILTGEYPKLNHVRTNLIETMEMNKAQTLPAILQQQGYHTIFAMDETRFSNIDHSFGFDETITPPIGFNDFLLGTVNDFPMSNLLVNTKLGYYLFPNSYANRAVFITYRPETFIHHIEDKIKNMSKQPIFLSVHFCLPHLPYIWSDLVWSNRYLSNYRAALTRVDEQVGSLLAILKKNQLLDHSILVLLSDHGEAIGLPGDRVTNAELFMPGLENKNAVIPHFYPSKDGNETVNQSTGHGTDVLGLAQYHTVLAFRFFGVDGQQPKILPGQVSLLDIKPTLLSLLNIQSESSGSGKSLVKYLNGQQSEVPIHDFFIESDFSPDAVYTVFPEARKVLFQGIDYFQINPETTRISVKKSMYDWIVSSKQYADIYGEWILALYPQNKKPMIPILVNLKSGLWTNDLQSDFAKTAPTTHMVNALQDFFGEDIREIENFSS